MLPCFPHGFHISVHHDLKAAVLLLFCAGQIHAQGGWIQSYITGQLSGVAYPDPAGATAVGTAGVILHSSDGGETWTAQSSSTQENLQAVAFYSVSRGIAVGEYGSTCRTSDGGMTWVQTNTPLLATMYGVALESDSTAIAVGQGGSIFRSSTAGAEWSLEASPLIEDLLGVSFFTHSIAVAVGGASSGKIIRSTDSGVTWSEIEIATSDLLHGVAADASGLAIAVGDNGLILRSTDFGLNWERGVSNSTRTLFSVALQGGSRATVSGNGVLLATSDAGEFWNQQFTFPSQGGRGVSFATPLLGISVGSNVIVRTRSAGAVYWNRMWSGTSRRLRGVVFDTPGRGIAVGDSGAVLRTVNAGAVWTTVAAGSSVTLYAVGAFGNGWFVAAGDGGTALRSTDAGLTWSPLPVPTGTRLRAVKLISDGRGFIAGDSAVVLRTTDFGDTWSKDTYSGWTFSSIDMEGAFGFLVSDRLFYRACLRTTDAGLSWIQTGTPGGAPAAVRMLHPDTAVVAGSAGIMKTTNAGALWVTVSGTTNGQALSLEFFDRNHGVAGRSTGIIELTTDGGNSWWAEPTGAGGAMRALAFTEAESVVAVGDSGIILKRLAPTPESVGPPEVQGLPARAVLDQNYPNPFNGETRIGYRIHPGSSRTPGSDVASWRTTQSGGGMGIGEWVTLKVYDLLGREIVTLVDEHQEAGEHAVVFESARLSSGIYFYRLQCGSFTQTRPMILLR